MKLFLLMILFSTSLFAAEIEKEKINRGRHLVKITGCNDCHTPMYGMKNGEIPEKDWLVGDVVGFSGPWGTSYPSNLRKMVTTFQEKAWIAHVKRQKYLPPMPGYALVEMTDDELGSIYAFIKHLGDAGKAAPAALPPGQKSKTPTIHFVPVMN